MSKYSINIEIATFEHKDIADKSLGSILNSSIIVVIDKDCEDRLYEYYTSCYDMIAAGNRLIAIFVGKEISIKNAICMLMASYKQYDIYEVPNRTIITAEYIEKIMDRHATIDEVQTFMGGNISAYAELNIFMLGVENLVSVGDSEGLKNFVAQRMNSIASFVEVIDYMKLIVDSSNSGQMKQRFSELQELIKSKEDEISNIQYKMNMNTTEVEKLNSDIAALKKEITGYKEKVAELENSDSGSSQAIKTYKPLNMKLINCRTKVVLYFKEVSQIPYINSMISALFSILVTKKLKVKLLIYDSKISLVNTYAPYTLVDSSKYLNAKDTFISSTPSFVVVEPNQAIITDILQYDRPSYDVVIIYDRLRQAEDIVLGNNVYKYFVVNSKKDINELANKFKGIDKSSIITRHEENVKGEYMSITPIDDYSNSGSDSARISKYNKMAYTGPDGNKIGIIRSIIEKSKISTLIN